MQKFLDSKVFCFQAYIWIDVFRHLEGMGRAQPWKKDMMSPCTLIVGHISSLESIHYMYKKLQNIIITKDAEILRFRSILLSNIYGLILMCLDIWGGGGGGGHSFGEEI